MSTLVTRRAALAFIPCRCGCGGGGVRSCLGGGCRAGGNILIVIVKGFAVDPAVLGDHPDGDIAQRIGIQQLQEARLDGLLCKTGHGSSPVDGASMIPLKKTSTNGAYAEMANKAADGMIKNYSGDLLSKPALIAKTVRKAVTKRRPRTRYLVGFGAPLHQTQYYHLPDKPPCVLVSQDRLP